MDKTLPVRVPEAVTLLNPVILFELSTTTTPEDLTVPAMTPASLFTSPAVAVTSVIPDSVLVTPVLLMVYPLAPVEILMPVPAISSAGSTVAHDKLPHKLVPSPILYFFTVVS